jgi:hypothetical protein
MGAELEGSESIPLFDEQAMVVLSCAEGSADQLRRMLSAAGATVVASGKVGGSNLRGGDVDVSVAALREAYETGLARALEGVTANA